jgi:hypothetical protein
MLSADIRMLSDNMMLSDKIMMLSDNIMLSANNMKLCGSTSGKAGGGSAHDRGCKKLLVNAELRALQEAGQQ